MTMTNTLWFRRAVISGAAVILIGLAAVTALRMAGAVAPQEQLAYDFSDFDAADFEKPEIPNDENAASWLQAGAGSIERSVEEKGAVAPATFLPYAEWSPTLERTVREALERHRGGLETMHMGVGLERSSYGIRYSEGIRAKIPDLLVLLDANRLLMLDAQVALADDEEQRTLNALATMSRLASSLAEESTLITTLVAIACERMQLTVAAEILGSDTPWVADARFLDELEATISDADGAELIGRDFDAWSAVMELHLNGLAPGDDEVYGDIEVTLADADKDLFADTRADLLARLAVPFGRNPNALTRTNSDTLYDSERGDVFADMEGFSKAIGRLQSVHSQRQLVRAAVAMRRHVHSHGAYPAERPAVPELTEPDPFTGRPLIYEPQPDGSLKLEIDGVVELLERIILASAAQTVVPIHLPAP
jgi:hypothetical protein